MKSTVHHFHRGLAVDLPMWWQSLIGLSGTGRTMSAFNLTCSKGFGKNMLLKAIDSEPVCILSYFSGFEEE